MSVRRFSEMTYFTALSLVALCKSVAAQKLFQQLLNYAKKLEKAEAQIDYFATWLPTLLFDEDIKVRQQTSALFMHAQAHLGLGSGHAPRCFATQVCDSIRTIQWPRTCYSRSILKHTPQS